MKYKIAVEKEVIFAAIIHAIWPMDENARRGRRFVWFCPPRPPMIALEVKIVRIGVVLFVS